MLVIGAVLFRIRSSLSLPHLCAPAFAAFLKDVCSSDSHISAIDLEVLEDECPPIGHEPRYDTTGGLSVQTEESGYRLRLHRRGQEVPHTTICSNPDTTEVKVFLQDEPASVSQQWGGPPVASLSTLVLRMVLMNHLASRGGVVLHAAGGVVDGKALVFPGVSTAGKSTLMQSFLDVGAGDTLLSDDRIVIRADTNADELGSRYGAWGTPWSSGAGVARNATAPLEALLFLVKSAECRLERLSSAEALQRLMPAVSYPWYDEQRSGQVLDTCLTLVRGVPCYELHFSPGEDVVELLTRFSAGDNKTMLDGAGS